MSNVFGKLPISAGVQVLEDVGGTGLSGVVLGNESGLTCEITLQGAGVNRTLYPGTADFFEVPKGRSWSGNLQIDPSSNLSNASSWPSSFVQVDTFGFNEKPAGVYPISFFRAGNVGNTVDTNTVSAVTTNVTNDGNPATTVFIEATQSGNASGSNVVERNDGSFFRSQYVSNVLTRLLELVVGASPLFKIGKGVQVEMADSGSVFSPVMFLNGSDYLNLQCPSSSNHFIITAQDGTPIMTFSGNSLSCSLGPGSAYAGEDHNGNAADLLGVSTSSGNTQLFSHPTGNAVDIVDSSVNTIATFDGPNKCLNLSGTVQTVNGDTSGTMTVQEIFSGGSKWVIVKQNNYRQAAATPQQLVLKNTFTGPFGILNLGCGGMQILNGASVQSGNYFNSMVATGSAFLAETSSQQATIGWNNTAIDRVQSQGSYASAHTGVFILAGF